MSFRHYEYAKEIERVLKLGNCSRAMLYAGIAVCDKNERDFGVVLAEMCQGREPMVSMVHGTYCHNRSVMIPKPRPELAGIIPMPKRKNTSNWRPKREIRKCGRGAEMVYDGKGRPPRICKACHKRERAERDAGNTRMTIAQRMAAIVSRRPKIKKSCVTCGLELGGTSYNKCSYCRNVERRRRRKQQSRKPA